MISSKQADEPKTCGTEDVILSTEPNLNGDWSNFFLLTLMYTMQGFCFGVNIAISLLLKGRHDGTYNEQAVFSFTIYPFSLKLLWAPLVDSYYVRKFGRRKSWLVPAQLIIGVVILYAARDIDTFLPENGKPNINALMVIFFLVKFLCATQDIAVDGWALTMLKRNNVGYASTCNSTGMALGSLIGTTVTILLTSKEFCNKYLRYEPNAEGILTLNSLLYCWGITFILLTTLIAIFKKEKDSTLDDDYLELNVVQSYSLLWNIFKIRNIQILAVALLTAKIGFATTDYVSNFKLMDAGISIDDITIIQSVLPGINIIVPLIVAKYTSGPKAMSVYLKVIPYRLLLNMAYILFVYLTPKLIKKDGFINVPVYYYVILGLLTLLQQICMYIMFVAIIAFFSRISDPRFGGTYMTLLNTLANLGDAWTTTTSFGLINLLTLKKCSDGYQNINASNEDDCVTIVDGYYVEEVLCSVIGIIWISIFGKKLKLLQTLSASHWLVHGKSTVTAVDKDASTINL